MKKPNLHTVVAVAIVVAVVAIFAAATMATALRKAEASMATQELEWEAKEVSHKEEVEKLTKALWNEKWANQRASEVIIEQQAKIESMRFIPIEDSNLSIEEQACAFALSQYYEVPFKAPIVIAEHETNGTWIVNAMDTNGEYSTGFMMLNAPTWDYLAARGINVHTRLGNIHGGIYILAEHMKNSGYTEQAFVFYECGYTGGQGIKSTDFSRWALERMEEL